MKRAAFAAVLVALLAPQAAAAKEISALRVCGAHGCTDVDVPEALHEFPGGMGGPSAPPPAGPFVEVVLRIDGVHTERLWYVPAARAFASDAEVADSVRWSRAGEQEIDRLIVAAAAKVAPRKPRAIAALVGDERIEGDVSGYLGLFAIRSSRPTRPGTGGFEPVSVKTEPPSPWALTPLWFYPDEGLLQRGPELIQLSQGVAGDLRAARSIGETRGGGFDWPLVTGSLVVAFALALTTALLVRRSRPARPGTV
jgi:hypothetical protein